jgi:hypothetical protein
MAITRTQNQIRPNTSVEFFSNVGDIATSPAFQAQYAAMSQLENAGSITRAITVSEDGLTLNIVTTFADLTALSQLLTAQGITHQKEMVTYKTNNGFAQPNHHTLTAQQRADILKLEGIDAPYTVTTTYTFTSPTDAYIDTFVAGLETYDHFNKLTDLVINGADVILTHQYLNSADQTAHPYLDQFFVLQLVEKGVTRSIQYAMV